MRNIEEGHGKVPTRQKSLKLIFFLEKIPSYLTCNGRKKIFYVVPAEKKRKKKLNPLQNKYFVFSVAIVVYFFFA